MNKASLLLVDDDHHVLDSMADWLRGQGYEVAGADSYRAAMKLLETPSFDLVLSDVRLQDGDGFELLAHCRKNHPSLPVILLTGYGRLQQKRNRRQVEGA